MDTIALWLGYIVIVSGGCALAGVGLQMALNLLWEKLRLAHDFRKIRRALAMYEKRTPEPDTQA